MHNYSEQINQIKDSNLKQLLEEMVTSLNELLTPATIHFAKVKPNAIVPSKRSEDAAFDIYACVNQHVIVINPNQTLLIPTGIATAFNNKYAFILKERGSTGTKGMGQRCGVIDSGFRGEIFAPITNLNDKPIVICKEFEKDIETISIYNGDDGNLEMSLDMFNSLYKDAIVYPYSKAICQGMLVDSKDIVTDELDYETLKSIPSERGIGMLGSSTK